MANGTITNQSSQNKASRIFGQYIINNHFQFKFGLILFSILAISTFVLWLEGHMAISRLIESDMVKNDLLLEQLKLIGQITGKTAMLISVFTFAIALFLSHFIAGPMYRFEKTFQDMANGNITGIVRLRKHDQFQDVATALNYGLSGLRGKLKIERDELDLFLNQAKKLIQSINQTGTSPEAQQLEKIISEFKKRNLQIKI